MFTNHTYNHLTMRKQTADVGLNCLCYLAVFETVQLCADRWALSHLECYQLRIHLEILGLICVWVRLGIEGSLQGLICHKTQQTKETNQTKLENILSF